MTNGEKFKEVFKISQVDECDLNIYAWLPIHDAIEIPREWWNAEYKESKTGYWIKTGDYYTGAYGSIDYVKCSCCGEDSLEEGDYCPNCGAKMFEPQESEDNNVSI